MRLIRPRPRSSPRPQSSTPQLLDTTRRSPQRARASAAMSVEGMPQSPKPPTASVAPSGMSATAWSAEATTLSMRPPSPWGSR
jgi:hypothetical protein